MDCVLNQPFPSNRRYPDRSPKGRRLAAFQAGIQPPRRKDGPSARLLSVKSGLAFSEYPKFADWRGGDRFESCEVELVPDAIKIEATSARVAHGHWRANAKASESAEPIMK